MITRWWLKMWSWLLIHNRWDSWDFPLCRLLIIWLLLLWLTLKLTYLTSWLIDLVLTRWRSRRHYLLVLTFWRHDIFQLGIFFLVSWRLNLPHTDWVTSFVIRRLHRHGVVSLGGRFGLGNFGGLNTIPTLQKHLVVALLQVLLG